MGDPFKVQITVLTPHVDAPTATSAHTLIDDEGNPIAIDGDTGLTSTVDGAALLRREVEVHLANNFVNAKGEPVCLDGDCISFEVSNIRFRADIEDSSCKQLLALGTADDPSILDGTLSLSDEIERAVDACDDPRVRAPKSLNLYIFDSCKKNESGETDCTNMIDSRGRNNEIDGVYSPYVFLDIARLQHQTQAPEEHEFGHAFGLQHTCHPDVEDKEDASNIMQSGCHRAESGGARNLGFETVQWLEDAPCDTGTECTVEEDQVALIMENARKFIDSWCTETP